jgi:hypothetical protein
MDETGCVGYNRKASNRDTVGSLLSSLSKSGIEFESGVSQNAKVMAITALAYFVIQIPALMIDDQKAKDEYASDKEYLDAVMAESGGVKIWAGVGAVVCLLLFCGYLYLQYVASCHEATKDANGETQVQTPYGAILPAPRPMPDGLVEDKGIALYIDAHRKQYRDPSGKANMPYLAQPLTGDKPKLPSYLTVELSKLYGKYAARSKSKSIHSADMKLALEAVGLKYAHDKFDKLFADADKDRSNYLDKGEFLEFFSTIISSSEPLPW